MQEVICPYCKEKAELASSTRVYFGRDYGKIWLCRSYPLCDSYVGVHKGTDNPLGRMADKELRRWKNNVHALFDQLWVNEKKRKKARTKAYAWLAEQLDLHPSQCHVGMFDVDTCKRAVNVCIKNQTERKTA